MTILQQRDLFTKRYRRVVEPQKEATSLHIPLVAMLRWCLRPDVIFRHYPAGEHRDPRTAAKLKAMGVLPGQRRPGILLPQRRRYAVPAVSRTQAARPQMQ